MRLLLGFGLALLGVSAYGQLPGTEKPLGVTAQAMPQYLKNAGLQERLNQPLPLGTSFVDAAGDVAGAVCCALPPDSFANRPRELCFGAA